MASEKKILLSTVYKRHKRDVYDYWSKNSRVKFFNYTWPRIQGWGLRFIKQNIPEIEILEYPTWTEYANKLKEKKWGVVGFSFYLNEIHEILEMIKYARKRGIEEIWGGNYGALTPELENHFDKRFFGYSESELAEYMGKEITDKKIIHPPLIGYVGTTLGFKVNKLGYLFTQRGCPYSCDFCQTPQFCNKPYKLSLESIDTVLKYYKENDINTIVLADENFGTYKKHTREVVSLLDEYNFNWLGMLRADTLHNAIEEWSNKGMIGAYLGIENLNQKTLDAMEKRENIDEIILVVKKLVKMKKFTAGFYMIGFEHETEQSIKNDLKYISQLGMHITQICVVTPLPQTPLWDDIDEKYGIFDKDWHHYNAKHLVWNHPHISPKKMREILDWGFRQTFPPNKPIETGLVFFKNLAQNQGFSKTIILNIKNFIEANTFDYHPKKDRFIEQ